MLSTGQPCVVSLCSEVHTSIGGLFSPMDAPIKAFFLARAATKLKFLETEVLKGKEFLVGGKFSIADAYLYIVLSWVGYVGVDTSPFPAVQAYFERIKSLDNVKAAHARMAEAPSHI